MKKRLLASFLSFLLAVTTLPVSAWTRGTDLTETPSGIVEAQAIRVVQADAQAFAGSWANAEGITFGRMLEASWGSTTSYLNETERAIYTQLKSIIELQSTTGGLMAAEASGCSFQVTHSNGASQEEIQKVVSDYLDQHINTNKILSCLVIDLPYNMYWFDKMSDTITSFYYSTNGTTTTVSTLRYELPVYETYQGDYAESPENSKYYLDPQAAARAESIVAYAKQIVDENKNKSDWDKLKAYKDKICELVSYNTEASDIASDPSHPLYPTLYGDPFQILYVFDQDPSTNVVCEGYGKAFQYLCDLSTFDNTQVYSIIGELQGGTGVPGGHMWNVVRYNGKNYVVDVTNCDEGTTGYPDYFFMASPISGSVESGYYFKDRSDGTKLTYSSQIKELYPDSILNLDPNKSYIYGTVSVSGTPKIGETLSAVTNGTPSGAALQYQWYRGDTPISGATDRTYIPSTAEDVGETMKVEVSAAGYDGTLSAQASGTVAKADTDMPTGKLTISSITKDTITIEPIPGCEYACKPANAGLPADSEWQVTDKFTGLTPSTKYYIYIRVKETPTHNASPVGYVEATTAQDDSKLISKADATLNGPVKNQPLPDVSVQTPYISASVQWYEGSDNTGTPVSVGTKAKAGQEYVAYVTIKTEEGYQFNAADFSVNVTGTNSIGAQQHGSASLTQCTLKVTYRPTAAKALSGITITKQPSQTAYYIGDNFNNSGMEVTANYDDDSSETVTGYTVSPTQLAAGTTYVTISYNGFSAEVPVTVSKRPVDNANLSLDVPVKYQELDTSATVNAPSNITAAVEWYEGDSVVGGPVTGKAKAGQVYMAIITLTAPENYEFTDAFKASLNGENLSVSGSGNTVTITKTFPATENRVLESIQVTKQPDKTRYSIGDRFDSTGMVVTATYDDGNSEEVTGYTVSPEVMTADITAVTISYGGKSDTVAVEVKEWHSVTVIGGSAEFADYEEGATVTITAGTSEGQHFTSWTVTSGGVTLADSKDKVTTFLMPDGDVTITANFENHIYTDDGDCTTEARCEVCDEIAVPASSHIWGGWTSNGDGTHTGTCQHDGCTKTTVEDCTGGTAGYFEKAVCEVCGGEYGEYGKDTTAPTGGITVGTNHWREFLNVITFGLFFNDTQSVEITAWDDSYDQAGYSDDKEAKVEYYLSHEGMTLEEVKALADSEWTEYTQNFNLDPNDQYVIYVKITDHAGNTAYIGSDGIVVDNYSPDFSGIENGKVYCGAVTGFVLDDNIDVVTVNGQPIELGEGNSFILNPADGEQVVYARDKSGNEFQYIVTVNDGHTFTNYISNNDATCTADGTETATCEYCDETDIRVDEGSMHAHTMAYYAAKPGNCTEKGNVEYWFCSECGKNYDSKNGGNVIYDVTTPIVEDNHNIIHHEAQVPTCTEIGWNAYETCSRCDYTTYEEIPATGHNWSEEFDWSEDGKSCTVIFTCQNDATHVEELSADVTPEVVTAASCLTVGEIAYTATAVLDGETYQDTKRVTVPATGHNWSEEFNWSEDGKSCTVIFTCQNDNTHTEELAATVTSKVKTEATCTEMGTTAYTVTVEFYGKTYSDSKDVEDIEALGHGETELKGAKKTTCTEEGYTGDKVCSICGKVVEQGTSIEKIAHNYKDGKCTVCGTADPDYKPDDTEAIPDTGDDKSTVLWFVLLFVSSIGAFGMAALKERRKLFKK